MADIVNDSMWADLATLGESSECAHSQYRESPSISYFNESVAD